MLDAAPMAQTITEWVLLLFFWGSSLADSPVFISSWPSFLHSSRFFYVRDRVSKESYEFWLLLACITQYTTHQAGHLVIWKCHDSFNKKDTKFDWKPKFQFIVSLHWIIHNISWCLFTNYMIKAWFYIFLKICNSSLRLWSMMLLMPHLAT